MSLLPEKIRNLMFQIGKLVVEREEEQRWKQIINFDRRHRAQDLSPALHVPGDLVWIRDRREQGTLGD